MDFLRASIFLVKRDIVRFLRQRSRMIGAFVFPLVMWIVIGSGIGELFRGERAAPGQGYLEYLFPGTIAMILLFTGIFSTVSLIEDRREGFLQGVLVAPISRMVIVLGATLGAAVLATAQGMVFCLLGPMFGISIHWISWILMAPAFFLVAWILACVGFLLAWRVSSTQGFHALMNLILFPMWLLSGSVFPVETAPLPLKIIMQINPLTYGVAILRRIFYFGYDLSGLPTAKMSLIILMGFGLIFLFSCMRSVNAPNRIRSS